MKFIATMMWALGSLTLAVVLIGPDPDAADHEELAVIAVTQGAFAIVLWRSKPRRWLKRISQTSTPVMPRVKKAPSSRATTPWKPISAPAIACQPVQAA